MYEKVLYFMYKIFLIVTCLNFYCVYERFSLHFHVVNVHLSTCMIWWSYSRSPIIYERSMFHCYAFISWIMCNKTFSPLTGLYHPCLMFCELWICCAYIATHPWCLLISSWLFILSCCLCFPIIVLYLLSTSLAWNTLFLNLGSWKFCNTWM